MTVKHMRIDNRLIHGQVTVNWVQSVGAEQILVVNDQVANDPIQKVLLPKAARGVKTSVLSVDDAITFVNEHPSVTILIVAKFPADALKMLQAGVKPEQVNVGNQAPLPATKYTMVTHSIAVTADDAKVYRDIAGQGITLTSQMLPSDSKLNFIDLLAKKGL